MSFWEVANKYTYKIKTIFFALYCLCNTLCLRTREADDLEIRACQKVHYIFNANKSEHQPRNLVGNLFIYLFVCLFVCFFTYLLEDQVNDVMLFIPV